jgi:Xaa-Pro aminopeptidase
MKETFSSDFFEHNRQVLKTHLADDMLVVLTANGLVQRAGDSGFPFRQDSNFWYLTGIQLADGVLVMTPKTEFMILPERNPVLDYFEGAIDADKLADMSGIKQIMPNHQGWEQLIQLTKKHKTIGTCLYKGFDERHAIYMNPSKPRLVSRLKKLAPRAKFSDIRPIMTSMRMVKQPLEIMAIQQAVDISVESFKAIFSDNWHEEQMHESMIDASIGYEFAKRGASPAYPSIVAGGKRACTLHYEANNQPIASDELLLVDAGAEYSMYASDITRVYSPNKMSVRQKDVYDAVKEIQAYTIDLLKPGVDIKQVDKKVEKKIGQFLKASKLITKQDTSQIRKYYPHAVSHHLGLDVHDVADYSKPLTEGNVITVEPGIYIPEWNIGVRIEDDILITDKNRLNLSANLPS